MSFLSFLGSTVTSPLGSWVVTSPFGERLSPDGIGSTNHKGVDLRAPLGTPVYAATDGSVSSAGWRGGYGNYIGLSGDDYSSGYGHLSSILVSPSDTVSQGDLIGYSGNTGKSTAPHLHFELMDANGNYLNPESVMAGNPISAGPNSEGLFSRAFDFNNVSLGLGWLSDSLFGGNEMGEIWNAQNPDKNQVSADQAKSVRDEFGSWLGNLPILALGGILIAVALFAMMTPRTLTLVGAKQ